MNKVKVFQFKMDEIDWIAAHSKEEAIEEHCDFFDSNEYVETIEITELDESEFNKFSVELENGDNISFSEEIKKRLEKGDAVPFVICSTSFC